MEVKEIFCLYFCYGVFVYYFIVSSEVLFNFVCYDGVKYGFWVEDSKNL